MGESATAFINRAIDEAMARDKQNNEKLKNPADAILLKSHRRVS